MNDGALIPKGEYLARIEQSTVKANARSEGEHAVVTFTLLDPAYADRQVVERYHLKNTNPQAVEIGRRNLARLAEACGFDELEETNALIGQQVMIGVETSKGNPRFGPSNIVTSYRAAPADAPQQEPNVATESAPSATAAAVEVRATRQSIDIKVAGTLPDGRTELHVVAGDVVILQDALTLASAEERAEFVGRVSDVAPALNRDVVEGKVAELAAATHDVRRRDKEAKSSRVLPYEPPPLDTLPEPVRNLVEVGAASIDCDQAFVLMPALGVLSVGIGNTYSLRVKPGWVEGASLWTAIVAESGGGKSPGGRVATMPLKRRAERLHRAYEEAAMEYVNEVARYEKARQKAKDVDAVPNRPEPPKVPHITLSDATPEAVVRILATSPRGVLLYRDELAGWLAFDRYAKSKGGEAAFWCSVHSQEGVQVDRASGLRLFVPNPFCAVTGGIQPQVLSRMLAEAPELVDCGLCARLLLSMPPSWPRSWSERGMEATGQRWSDLVDDLFALTSDVDEEGKPKLRLIDMTPEAKTVWAAWYEETEGEREAAGSPAERAAWSKTQVAAARLALVIYVTRQVADHARIGSVDDRAMMAAVSLARWLGREATRTYTALGSSEDATLSRLLERVRAFAKRYGRGPTPAEWARQTQRGRRDVRRAEAQLRELEDQGLARWVDVPAAQGQKATRRLEPLPTSLDPTLPDEGEASTVGTWDVGRVGVPPSDVGQSPLPAEEVVPTGDEVLW